MVIEKCEKFRSGEIGLDAIDGVLREILGQGLHTDVDTHNVSLYQALSLQEERLGNALFLGIQKWPKGV